MEKSVVCFHLSVLLLMQVALLFTPVVSGIGIGDACNSTSDCVTGVFCDNQEKECRIIIGDACNSTSQCVTGATCDIQLCKVKIGDACNSTNQCVTGATCDTQICRVNIGDACNSASHCVTGAVCDIQICRVNIGGVCSSVRKCVTGAVCDTQKCKLPYGVDCSNHSSSCSTDLKCQPLSGVNSSKCLCNNDAFRYNGQCYQASHLTVSNIQRVGNPSETSLKINWTAPSAASNGLNYRIVIKPEHDTQNTSSTMVSFSSRNPGTEYTVSVYTSAIRDPDHDTARIESHEVKATFFTKPAKPGSLTTNDYSVPNVTLSFQPSAGNREKYLVNISYMSLVEATKNVTSPHATFTSLDPGKTYNVEIFAISGEIYSDPYEDTFFVAVEPAGPVNDIQVLKSGSRWIELKWQKPTKPNGDIQGYTVEILTMADSVCAVGLSILCSDCVYNASSFPNTDGCLDQIWPINKTKADLNQADIDVQLNITGLKPYTYYTMEVRAYNQKGKGEKSKTYMNTSPEAARTLKSVSILKQAKNQLTVMWEPGEKTGPTSYNVSWSEKESLTSSTFVYLNSTTVTGYENTNYTITGLLSFWEYEVSVFPSTSIADPPADTTTHRSITLPSKPGLLLDVSLTQLSDSAQKITLAATCPVEKQRNGQIIAIGYKALVVNGGVNQFQTPPSGEILVTDDCTVSKNITVVAESSYNISVFAKTSQGEDGMARTETISVEAKPPKLGQSTHGSALVTEGKTTTTSISLSICSCMANTYQGRITLAGITVCVPSSSETCEPETDKHKNASYYKSLPTWKKFMDQGRVGRYRPTPDNFYDEYLNEQVNTRRRTSSITRVTYTIGNNTTCGQLDDDVNCNGPLHEGKNYKLILWACTKGGCTEFADVISVKTRASPEEQTPVGAIVGSLFAVLILAVIAVAIFVMYRRRWHPGYQKKMDANDLDPPGPKMIRRPMKLGGFANHLERLHQDSNLLFQEEYEDIRENEPKGFSQDAATRDENKAKNRYVNILPYDHTRVKLKVDDDGDDEDDDDDGRSDFINANYIPGYSSPTEYIATQGPLAGTVVDFWKMVWEQESSLIIMLSDLQEKGRPKVDMYWPGELNSPVQYGNVVVQLTSDSTLNKYTIRTFSIYVEEEMADERRVVQYFIPGWEDYSANLSPDDVLEFIKSTRQEAKSSRGPIIVHCSAGVGRTGTFIALDFLMQFVRDHSLDDEVDIYNLVLNMRHNRPLMVQSENQYIFIHDTLKVIIDAKIKEMQENDNHVYDNNVDDQIYVNEAFAMEENLYENASLKPTTTL